MRQKKKKKKTKDEEKEEREEGEGEEEGQQDCLISSYQRMKDSFLDSAFQT